MSDPSPSSSSPSVLRRLGLTRRTWVVVAAAFVFGLLLFLAIWMRQRHANDFFRAGGPERPAAGEQFTPLPVPDTTATDSGGLPAAATPRSVPGDAPAIAPSPPVSPPPLDALPASSADAASAATDVAHQDVAPVPVDRPSPRYPPDALRRGETGDVVLRIHVDGRGTPGDIDLVRGSGSRQLDRAATDAVRRWRFRPALRAGQPVDGAFKTTITFRL